METKKLFLTTVLIFDIIYIILEKGMIELKDLVIGRAYELEARNLRIGIWDGREFHGIRHKFGNKFIDGEIHWDLDDFCGTAKAVRELK